MSRTNLSPLKNEDIAAPVDFVTGEAGEPDPEGDEIAQRKQPQVAAHGRVMHHAFTNLKGDGGTQSGGGGESCPRPPAQRREDNGKDGPGQAEGEQQAEIAEAARVAGAARPAQLMIEELAEAVGGQMGFDDDIRQNHFIAGFGDAVAKLKIVSKVVNQRAQAADGLKRDARHGQGGAESEVNAAFYLARRENAGDEISADAERFKLRAQSIGGNAARSEENTSEFSAGKGR